MVPEHLGLFWMISTSCLESEWAAWLPCEEVMTKLQVKKGMEKGVLGGDCVEGTGDARG